MFDSLSGNLSPHAWNFGPLFPASLPRQATPFVHGPESPAERVPHARHVDWHRLYPSEVILNGPTMVRQVSLTFDDGPDDIWTPQILGVLGQYGVKGTFNCVGQRVQQYPQMTRRIVNEGHMIGNHSYNHPNFTKITLDEVRNQVDSTSTIIQQTAGVRPRFFRPPYGALSSDIIDVLMSMNYKILFWDVDSLDWAGLTAAEVSINVLSHAGPGSIILMHFAGGPGESLMDTVQALPYIIQYLRNEKYSFATISELLTQPAYAPS